MNKKSMFILGTALVALFSSTYGVFVSSGAADSLFKTNELKALEQEQLNFVKQNKKAPDELMTKIKLETQYSKDLAEEMKKREQEIQQIQEKRNNAPKDAKGIPIIPAPVFSDQKPQPYEEVGQIGDRDYAESFFPKVFTFDHELVSAITSSYHVLVSGVDKNDSTRGFIIDINNAAEVDQPGRQQYDFEGKGKITFTKLIDNRIAIFNYGDNEEGYFDITNHLIEFHPYK